MTSPLYQSTFVAVVFIGFCGTVAAIDVQSETKGRMLLALEREKESYRHTIAIDGDSPGRHVVLSPSDFTNQKGETLKDWNNVDIVITSTGAWAWDHLKIRRSQMDQE